MGAHVLCGPVIGLVTMDTAIVLLEIDREQTVTMVLRPKHDGEEKTSTQIMPEKRPTIFKFNDLVPNTKYDVIIQETEVADFRTGRVVTFPRDPQKINVAVVSCDYPERTVKVDMWGKLHAMSKHEQIHVVLHLGDNVYIDGDVSDKLSNKEQIRNSGGIFDHGKVNQEIPYVRARALLAGLSCPEEWEAQRPAVLELYRQRYRYTWSRPNTAAVLRSISNLMILDDHEIRDDFGLEDTDGDPDSREYWLGSVALQVYHEYQRQLWDPDILSPDRTQTLYNEAFSIQLGPLGIVMMDARTPSSIYRNRRHQGDTSYYGNEQIETMRQCLNPDNQNTRMWLIGCALPLLFFKRKINKILKGLDKTQDDLDAFIKRTNEDLAPIWDALRTWKKAKGTSGDVMLLAGDVHVGGFTDVFTHDNHDLLCHQITTSPIHNAHWSKLEYWSGQFVLEGCTDKYDDVTYKHYDWINSCNFALLRMDFRRADHVVYDVRLVREKGRPLYRNSRDNDWNRSSVIRFFNSFFCVRF